MTTMTLAGGKVQCGHNLTFTFLGALVGGTEWMDYGAVARQAMDW